MGFIDICQTHTYTPNMEESCDREIEKIEQITLPLLMKFGLGRQPRLQIQQQLPPNPDQFA